MSKQNKVCILGEGAFGTAISTLMAYNGFEVKLWCYDKEIANSINSSNVNSKYFPEIKLDKKIRAFTNLQEIGDADFIFEAIPVKFLRSVFEQAKPFFNQQQIWVILSKGIEQNKLSFPSEILDDVFGVNNKKVIISGPSFATEILEKQITAVNITSNKKEYAESIQKILDNNFFKTFFIEDAIGLQICGALKNIVSIAIGIADGSGYKDNTKGLILTIGLNEIAKFIEFYKGDTNTVKKLCGIGDLVISSFGISGRNFKTGQMLGQGKKLEKILNEVDFIPEGINTVQSVYQIIKNRNLNLPLFENVYKIIFEDKNINEFFSEILK